MVSGSWNFRFPLRADGLAAFHGFSMIAKDLILGMGTKPFAIMKCLLKSYARKSHPPPQAHFPRVPGTFIADRIIVGRYPWYGVGKGPR